MSIKILKEWVNPILVGLLILFSMPIKLTGLQQIFENILGISIPIRLSLYTFFLPPVIFFCLVWNRKRTEEIWNYMRLPLIILAFLFIWMWIGTFMSDYPKIALKHSVRYSIILLTFISFIFILDRETYKKCSYIFAGTFIFLMVLTFLDLNRQINIYDFLKVLGMNIDLFFKYNSTHGPSSFFENRNPFAIVCVSMFFWYIFNIRNSWFLSSLGILASIWGFLISGSRNGFFTFSFCLIILMIFSFKKTRNIRLTFLFVFGCAILTVIAIRSIDNEMLGRTKHSFNKIIKAESYDDLKKLDQRFTLYFETIAIGIKKVPIIGSGSKTFGHEVISNSKDLQNINQEWYKNAFNSHNAFLTIWIEMGWVGLIGVIIFLYTWFKPFLKQYQLLLVMPAISICIGQVFDYFIWEILFMAFQSFFFANCAAIFFFEKEGKNFVSNKYSI